jgi:tetratricopeptide (TPR) repeat protein
MTLSTGAPVPNPGFEGGRAAAPALSDEELYQATRQELAKVVPPQSRLQAIGILIGTIALFAAASVFFDGSEAVRALLFIVPVLFLHEAGHYLGMRVFGYRDVTMFFIPLFGAAVSGRKHGAPVWQQAIVLLLGPLPGIVLALALQLIFAPAPGRWMVGAIQYLLIINAFNLLPIKPLDGGRIVDILFFARQPWLAAGFQVLAVASLAWLAWVFNDGIARVVFGGLAILMLLTVGSTFRAAALARTARDPLLELPDDVDQLNDGQRRELIARTITLNPADREPAGVAANFLSLYESLASRRPGLFVQGLLAGVYLAGIVAATGTLLLSNWVPPEIRAAEQAEYRALTKSLDGKPAEAVEEYKTALALRKKNLEAAPDDLNMQSRMAHTFEMMGLSQARLQQPAAALETFKGSLAMREQIAVKEPSRTWPEAAVASTLTTIGRHFGDQGRQEEALEYYLKGLAIREKLAAAEPGRDDWQSELGQGLENVGHTLVALGKPAEAVVPFRRWLDIAKRTAAKDPKNRTVVLGAAHRALASALLVMHQPADAIEHLQAAIAAYENDVLINPEYALLFRTSIDSETLKLGELLVGLGQSDQAVTVFRKALENREQQMRANEAEEAKTGKPGPSTALALRRVSFGALRARDFSRALSAAEQSLVLKGDDLVVVGNRAHALMFLGRRDEALAIYLAHKGKVLSADAGNAWEAGVAADFAELRKAGLDDPLMTEVAKILDGRPK